MKKRLFFIAVAMILCVCGAQAQQARRYLLSLEEMFELADQNNRHIQAHNSAVSAAQADIKTAKNAYLPEINMSLSASYLGDGTLWNRHFSDTMSVSMPHFGNNFALEVYQAVFTGGAIKTGVKIAELNSQIAALDAQNNRQQIRLLIVGNYMEKRKIENQLKVFDRHIAQTRKILEHMRQRYRQGVALRNDITRYELQLQNLRYSKIELENSKRILNNELASALGLPENSVIDLANIAQPSENEYNAEYWQEKAEEASSMLKLAERTVEMHEYSEKLFRAERWPQVGLFAGDYIDGPITIEVPVIDKNFNYWLAGIQLRYNFGSLYKSNKKIKAEQLKLQQAREEKTAVAEDLRLAVSTAFIRYQEAFVLRRTKEKSVELARQNYDTVSYRYQNGLVLITDLLDASVQKLDAELQAVNAAINITYNYYKLQYIAGVL